VLTDQALVDELLVPGKTDEHGDIGLILPRGGWIGMNF
jgi:hypothetical protein